MNSKKSTLTILRGLVKDTGAHGVVVFSFRNDDNKWTLHCFGATQESHRRSEHYVDLFAAAIAAEREPFGKS